MPRGAQSKSGGAIVPTAEEIEQILDTETKFWRECQRRERLWHKHGLESSCDDLCTLSNCCLRAIGPGVKKLDREEMNDLARRAHAGEYAYERLEEGSFEPEERERLERLVDMGLEAKHHIVLANIGLIVHLESKFNRGDMDQMDTIQAGLVGLMRAIESYEYASGYAFSTYAAFWINKSFQDARRLGEWLFCIPRDVYVTWNKVMYAEYNYDAPHGELPTDEEIAQKIGMSERHVTTARRAVGDAVPLDLPIECDGVQQTRRTIGDLLPDISLDARVEEAAQQNVLVEEVGQIVATLDEEDRYVVEHLYGIGGASVMKKKDIAAHLGLSSIILRTKRALKALREHPRMLSYEAYLED